MARDRFDRLLVAGTQARPQPLFAGAVLGLDQGGKVTRRSCGKAYAYADEIGTPLPPSEVINVTKNTIFDLASLTKLFTATVILQLVERGVIGLDDRISDYFTSYAAPGRDAVSIRHLLSHTSGLPAETFAWRDLPDVTARRGAVLSQPLETTPGTCFRYSCVGYLTLGLLAEHVTGSPMDVLVRNQICGPLGLHDTGYRPLKNLPPPTRSRIAATEMRRITWSADIDPSSGDHRGIVHDENAAGFGGSAGNAGVFGTVADLLIFGRAFLRALRLEGQPPGQGAGLGISPHLVREMVVAQLPTRRPPDFQTGLGFRIDDASFMGGLAGTGRAYGHTGFTGTSMIIDEARDLVMILLTNRVHPSRRWSELNPFRRHLADLVASQR